MQYDDWMSASDAIMWHIERDPVLRSTITTVWILDRPPDAERMRRTLERAVVHVPRLAQRVEADPLGVSAPRWVPEPGFDVNDHVDHQIIDGDHDDRALLDLAARIHEEPIDKNQPPWELHVVDGLTDGRGGIIVKAHHAIGDGLGLVQMLGSMVDFERDPADVGVPTIEGPETPPTTGSAMFDAVAHRVLGDLQLAQAAARAAGQGLIELALHPVQAAKDTARTAASIGHLLKPAATPMSPIMTERSLDMHFETISRPVTDLKAASRASGASINDVFVAAVAAGVDRYHRIHGVEAERLRINMPVSIRSGDSSDLAGNQFVPARFLIPAVAPDAPSRVREIREQLAQERAEPALPLVNEVSEMINRAGPVAATALLQGMMKAVDLVLSNVPGPTTPMYSAGARIERMIPFGPCAGAAVNITLLSYCGDAAMGINSDRAAVPDPEVLVECIEAGFDEILAVGRHRST